MIIFSLIVGFGTSLVGYVEDGRRGFMGGFLIGFAGFGPLFYVLMHML